MEMEIRVLILEDDLTWEPLWAAILGKLNGHVSYTWATNEKEAEKIIDEMSLRGESFDLIVSDVFVSGGRTGIDLLDKLGEEASKRVIFATGVDDKLLGDLIGERGFKIPILQKPYTEKQCLKLIRTVLDLQTV